MKTTDCLQTFKPPPPLRVYLKFDSLEQFNHLSCFVYLIYRIAFKCSLFLYEMQGGDASVNSVHLFPKNTDHIIVCNKTSSIYLMTLQGQVHLYFCLFFLNLKR